MAISEPKKQLTFEFDEQGAALVSEQIMNAYNDGFIDQEDVQGKENGGVNLDIH